MLVIQRLTCIKTNRKGKTIGLDSKMNDHETFSKLCKL